MILSLADDTAIIATEKNWQMVKQKMNQNLRIVSAWLKLNKFSLNMNKTVVINFVNYCNSVPLKEIKRVEKTKYLGIIIDYRLI